MACFLSGSKPVTVKKGSDAVGQHHADANVTEFLEMTGKEQGSQQCYGIGNLLSRGFIADGGFGFILFGEGNIFLMQNRLLYSFFSEHYPYPDLDATEGEVKLPKNKFQMSLTVQRMIGLTLPCSQCGPVDLTQEVRLKMKNEK
jgi:hypothetical protein